MKEDLSRFNREFNSFDLNEMKIEKIITEIEKVKPELNKELIQVQNKLISNMSYEFKPIQINNLNMQHLIGTFITKKMRFVLKNYLTFLRICKSIFNIMTFDLKSIIN